MDKWAAMIGVALVLVLLVILPMQHHWVAILILLALIFYALFYNPMHAMHKHAFGDEEKKPKRKLKRK